MDIVHSGRRQPNQQCPKSGSVTTIIVEDDRLSNLPNDIIHHILSFLDMKCAVQTLILSKQWKLIWNSMPHLNFNSQTFNALPQFSKFVEHVLSNRNNHTEVSEVKLALTRGACDFVGKSIVEYAYSHNVRKLTVTLIWSRSRFDEFPNYIFSCHTLKHLTLSVDDSDRYLNVPQSAWDFPALETLSLRNVRFYGDGECKSLDLFSKCVNLKDLSLHTFSMLHLKTFSICAPQLCNLTITNAISFPNVLNVVAPQLQNLTLSFYGFYTDDLLFSTKGFDSLEKVNISLPIDSYDLRTYVTVLPALFQKLRTTKFLILNVGVIKALSSYLDQVLHKACPFDNLKCLKIDTMSLKPKDSHLVTKVRSYLLQNSPTATIIMESDLTQMVGSSSVTQS